jgi:hypothetical protein
MGTTMRRIDTGQGGNRIITGTCAKIRPNMEAGPRASAIQRVKFADRFPQLAVIKTEHERAGYLCLSRNGVAVTQKIEEGVFCAAVQNGLGTARGT